MYVLATKQSMQELSSSKILGYTFRHNMGASGEWGMRIENFANYTL